MPILDVDKAANVVVLKRSMNSGFAGIDNPLFDDPKTVMLFGDAKKSIDGVVAGVKALNWRFDGRPARRLPEPRTPGRKARRRVHAS